MYKNVSNTDCSKKQDGQRDSMVCKMVCRRDVLALLLGLTGLVLLGMEKALGFF